MPAEVPHLQIAASLVITLMVVEVVLLAKVPVGAPLVTTGGVVSKDALAATSGPPPPQLERPRAANSVTRKTPKKILDPIILRFDIKLP